MPLDSGKPPFLLRTEEKDVITEVYVCNAAVTIRESREIRDLGKADRAVAKKPAGQGPTGCSVSVPGKGQASAATRFESLEILRAAVFLWMTPLVTPRAISGWTLRIAAWA